MYFYFIFHTKNIIIDVHLVIKFTLTKFYLLKIFYLNKKKLCFDWFIKLKNSNLWIKFKKKE